MTPSRVGGRAGWDWHRCSVAKLEAFGRQPDADMVVEFDKIPSAIVDLFSLGNRRSVHDPDALKSMCASQGPDGDQTC